MEKHIIDYLIETADKFKDHKEVTFGDLGVIFEEAKAAYEKDHPICEHSDTKHLAYNWKICLNCGKTIKLT